MHQIYSKANTKASAMKYRLNMDAVTISEVYRYTINQMKSAWVLLLKI